MKHNNTIKKALSSSLVVLISGSLSLLQGAAVWKWIGNAGDAQWSTPENWQYEETAQAPKPYYPNAIEATAHAIAIFGDFGEEALEIVHKAGEESENIVRLSRLQVTDEAKANLSIRFSSGSVLGKNTIEGDSVVQIASGGGLDQVRLFGASTLRMGDHSTTALLQIDRGITFVTTMSLQHSNAPGHRIITKTGEGNWNYEGTQFGKKGTYRTSDGTRGAPFALSLSIDEGTFSFNPGTANIIEYYGSADNAKPSFSVKSGSTLIMDAGTNGDRVQFLEATDGTPLTEGGQLLVETGAGLELNRLEGFEHGQWYTLFENIASAPESDFTVTNLQKGEQAQFQTTEINGRNVYQVQIVPES